ncbi:hypothetical protein EDC01DRAFT_490525 [Geopyxis carbonaria]|nr:hypothetical protein EDC01DRAFT_490525 [Geopyxis carbonaria]
MNALPTYSSYGPTFMKPWDPTSPFMKSQVHYQLAPINPAPSMPPQSHRSRSPPASRAAADLYTSRAPSYQTHHSSPRSTHTHTTSRAAADPYTSHAPSYQTHHSRTPSTQGVHRHSTSRPSSSADQPKLRRSTRNGGHGTAPYEPRTRRIKTSVHEDRTLRNLTAQNKARAKANNDAREAAEYAASGLRRSTRNGGHNTAPPRSEGSYSRAAQRERSEREWSPEAQEEMRRTGRGPQQGPGYQYVSYEASLKRGTTPMMARH